MNTSQCLLIRTSLNVCDLLFKLCNYSAMVSSLTCAGL